MSWGWEASDLMTIAEGTERAAAVPEKLAPQVARQLETEIMQRGWPIGQLLGSETDLRERFGVSRSVLREAIRLLEHQQIAVMKPGPGGGLIVRAPDASPVTRALVIYLEYVGTSVEDMLSARLLLEPLAARLVTETVTEDEIARLRAVIADERRPVDDPGRASDGEFHILLGRLSGNAALALFTEVLTWLTFEYARTSRHTPRAELEAARTAAAARHLDVVDALLAGDAASAQNRLIAHLHKVGTWLLAHRTNQSTQKMRTRPPDPQPNTDPTRKRAGILAGLIHDDIAGGGQQVGEVFGSETALLARYRVSRAVLREAVAILEHHSVAQMRRGHGGGLVILEPDPAASIHMMGLYLNHQGLHADHLRVVREVLELGCIQAATTAGLSPEGMSQLRAAVARGHSGEVFHTTLAELTGNPVLALFLRIVTQLWTGEDGHESTTGASDDDHGAHEKVLEAVLAGDEALARHRMRSHLRTLTTSWH